jgi:hypothetical protein
MLTKPLYPTPVQQTGCWSQLAPSPTMGEHPNPTKSPRTVPKRLARKSDVTVSVDAQQLGLPGLHCVVPSVRATMLPAETTAARERREKAVIRASIFGKMKMLVLIPG